MNRVITKGRTVRFELATCSVSLTKLYPFPYVHCPVEHMQCQKVLLFFLDLKN